MVYFIICSYLIVICLIGYIAHRFYFAGVHCKIQKRLDGKVAIITGSNSGIGFETALDLGKRGAKIVLACIDVDLAEAAANQIKLEANNKNVHVERLDLADLDSVRKFASIMTTKLTRLDILINNAGLMNFFYSKTKQGFEMHFGVNYLGHFLLTNLLLDLLKKTASGRIVNVSSFIHSNKNAKIDWNDLDFVKDKRSGWNRYYKSKLANVLFTYELAERFKNTGVTCVSVSPGLVRTSILKYSGIPPILFLVFSFLLYPILLVVSKSPKEGSQTSIYCAVADNISDFNGCYFSDCKPAKMSNEVTKENAKKLWDISAKLVDL